MNPYTTTTAAASQVPSVDLVKPRELHAYLTSSIPSTLERLHIITDATAGLVEADLDQATLLDYLNNYRKAVSVLKPMLDSQLVGLMLPPNKEDTEFYKQCSELYTNLAAVCKRIIRGAPEELKEKEDVDRANTAEICYWYILFLGEALRYAYSTYTQVPAEIWYEIHQSYQFSLARGIETQKVSLDDKARKRNIEHAYKRVLLLGVCDPYHFPFRSVHGVFKALDDWAKLVRISPQPRMKERCLFLINPNSDKPAMPVLPHTKLTAEEETLYLDTSTLVKILNRNLNQAYQQTLIKGQPKERIARELETREILKKLIVSWGIHPVRGTERKVSDDKCDLAIGLSSVTDLITAADESKDVKNGSIRRGLELVDESPHGVRIRVSKSDKTYVRVGELIAYKNQQQATSWSIGMIRWAQLDGDKFDVGVYKLLDNAMPVLISHVSLRGDKPFGNAVGGIWTVRKKGAIEVPSIIVDNGFYKPSSTIRVKRGSVQQIYESQDVVLSTRYFVWLDLSLTNATPRHSGDLSSPAYHRQS